MKKLTPLETVLAKAMAYWYGGYHCDETFFDSVDVDTADSMFLALNGHNLRSVKPCQG